MARNSLRRPGLSLLEMVIASTMLAIVAATVVVVLRSSREAWEAHAADFSRIEAAHATLRHIVREVRQADAVTALSASTDNSGSLSLRMSDGSIKVWDHDAGTNTVSFGISTANQLLAPDITGLRFSGFRANGTTATTVADDVQCLRVEVTVQLPREANGERIVSSGDWVRSC